MTREELSRLEEFIGNVNDFVESIEEAALLLASASFVAENDIPSDIIDKINEIVEWLETVKTEANIKLADVEERITMVTEGCDEHVSCHVECERRDIPPF